MPIRFRCQRCQQLLGIASGSAGSLITCPRCELSQTVPAEGASPEGGDDGDLGEAADVGPEVARSPTVAAAPRVPRPAPAAEGPQRGLPVPSGLILFPRRVFYVQALLYIVLAAVAFGMGYYIGRGEVRDEGPDREAKNVRRIVSVKGSLSYNSGPGRTAGDEDAVVFFLPAGKSPTSAERLSVRGLRPGDVKPADAAEAIAAIREIGGDYARVDASGRFLLELPDRGTYHMLILSGRAGRPDDAAADPQHLAEMKDYFDDPEALIRGCQYRWVLKEATEGVNQIKENLELAGQR